MGTCHRGKLFQSKAQFYQASVSTHSSNKLSFCGILATYDCRVVVSHWSSISNDYHWLSLIALIKLFEHGFQLVSESVKIWLRSDFFGFPCGCTLRRTLDFPNLRTKHGPFGRCMGPFSQILSATDWAAWNAQPGQSIQRPSAVFLVP